MSEITPEQAAETLRAAERQKLENFMKEYQRLCDKHGCEIVAVPALTNDGRIGARLEVRIR